MPAKVVLCNYSERKCDWFFSSEASGLQRSIGNSEGRLKSWFQEMHEILSRLTLAFVQLERSGKCCHGLTLSQCHTLDLLSKRDGLSMNEISQQMGLAKSTVTRIVDTMVRKGWVERNRGRGDHRRVHIRLTAKGREMVAETDRSSREYVKLILNHIPSGRRAEVMESLRLMITSIEKGLRREKVS